MRQRVCRAFGPLALASYMYDQMRFARFALQLHINLPLLCSSVLRVSREGGNADFLFLQEQIKDIIIIYTGKDCAGGLYCVQHCDIMQNSFVDELCDKKKSAFALQHH
jgi:hypothetical protein